MAAMLALSLPFAIVSSRSGRAWTLALPLVVWGSLALLQDVGVLSVFSGAAAPMLVISGTAFALGALAIRRRVTAAARVTP